MFGKLKPAIVGAFAVALLLLPAEFSAASGAGAQVALPGLDRPARVVRDVYGVPHVYAKSDHDAYFMVGYLHAQDRLFQMDQSRRQASGTLAELLGPGALASDVQLRTLGLRRAAAKSLAALSPAGVAVLQAYADGVNAWVTTHPLPSEYGALELTTFTPWTALDSAAVTKLLAFGLSFDLGDVSNTQRLIAYQTAGGALGFNGLALFREDVMRVEPFAHAPSILPGETSGPLNEHGRPAWSSSFLEDSTLAQAKAALKDAAEAGIATGAAERHRLERMGGVGLEVRQRTSDGCERPAPGAPLTVDVLRGRSRRLSAGLAEALRRDVSGRAVDRARDERAHRVGLDREPDRRDRRLPGNRRLDAERACDALQGQPRTAADHPGELPGQPGRERDAERRRGGAAEPGRAPGDARRAEARTADRAQPQRPVHRLLRDAGTRFLP